MQQRLDVLIQEQNEAKTLCSQSEKSIESIQGQSEVLRISNEEMCDKIKDINSLKRRTGNRRQIEVEQEC